MQPAAVQIEDRVGLAAYGAEDGLRGLRFEAKRVRRVEVMRALRATGRHDEATRLDHPLRIAGELLAVRDREALVRARCADDASGAGDGHAGGPGTAQKDVPYRCRAPREGVEPLLLQAPAHVALTEEGEDVRERVVAEDGLHERGVVVVLRRKSHVAEVASTVSRGEQGSSALGRGLQKQDVRALLACADRGDEAGCPATDHDDVV